MCVVKSRWHDKVCWAGEKQGHHGVSRGNHDVVKFMNDAACGNTAGVQDSVGRQISCEVLTIWIVSVDARVSLKMTFAVDGIAV